MRGLLFATALILLVVYVSSQEQDVYPQSHTPQTAESPSNTKGNVARALETLSNDLQMLGVEGFEQHQTAKQFFSEAIRTVKDAAQSYATAIRHLPDDFKELFVGNVHNDHNAFVERWNFVKERVQNKLYAVKDQMSSHKRKFQDGVVLYEDFAPMEGEDEKKWQNAKKHFNDKIDAAEQAVAAEVEKITNDWNNLVNLNHHAHQDDKHHPVMKCGNCGRQYTLMEFLALAKERGYFLREEDWWSDAEIEEFYGGWPVWATRSSFHCVQCDAVKWSDVSFVSKEEEKRIDESHPKRAEL